MNVRALIGLVFIIEVMLEAGFRLKTNLVQGLSLKNVFLYGLLLASLTNVFSNVRRHPKPVRHAYLALLLLTLLAMASVMFSPELGTFRQYNPLAQLLGVKGLLFDSLVALLVFSAGLPRTTDYWRIICYVIATIAAFVALMLVEVRMPNLDIYGFVTLEQRPRGPLGEPNQTAAVLALVLPAAIVASIRARGVTRILAAFGATLIGAALVVTGSRGGIVASVIGLGILAFAVRRELRASARVLALTAIPVLLVAGWALLPDEYQALIEKRVASISDVQSDARKVSAGRTMLWELALKEWRDSPILGHGWGYFREATGNVTHNDFLAFLVDVGVVGLLLYLFLWGCILRVIQLARRSGRGDGLILAGYQAGVISLLVAIFFVNLYLPWLVVWSFVGLVVAHCSSLILQTNPVIPSHGFSDANLQAALVAQQHRNPWSPARPSPIR